MRLDKGEEKTVTKSAVVGVGYLGTFHAEKYAKSPLTELVAVVDVDLAKARAVADRLGCQALDDYKKLPELGVQCASIAAVTAVHFDIALWLLDHGVDVLVEKPIATTPDQARVLISAAKANGRVLQVGHLERFNPAFRAMEKLLTQPRFFEARRIAQFAGRGHDVDVVLDLMIHDIDIISYLVGRPLLRVDAVGTPVLTDNVDIANARLTFEGGAVANVTASRAAFKAERTLRIFQPDVYISLDYGQKKLKMYHKAEGEGGISLFPGVPAISITEHSVEERDALADEIDAFLRSVESREQPVVSGEDGLRALELAERIRKAFQESASLLDVGDKARVNQ